MTPLEEEARAALDQFRTLPVTTPVDVEAIGAIRAVLDRMAQLEKVVKPAREILSRYVAADLDSPEWRLALALAELDAGVQR